MTLDSEHPHYSIHLNQIINPQFISLDEQKKEDIVFGIKIHHSTYSRRQNLYCLYLLLLKYGQVEHKLIMLTEIRKCLENLRCNLNKQMMNGGSKNLDYKKLQIESLQFFENELSDQTKKQTKSDKNKVEYKTITENDENKNKNIHSPKQKQSIIKGLITLTQNKNQLTQNPQTLLQNNKYDIPTYLNQLLNIKEQVKKYHKFTVIEFSCEQFLMKKISVFIEYNKQDKTLTYIKKHHQPSVNENYLHDLSFFSQSSINNLGSNCGMSQDIHYIEKVGIFLSEQEEVEQQQLEEVYNDFSKRTSSQKINSNPLYTISYQMAKPREQLQGESMKEKSNESEDEDKDKDEDGSEDCGIVYPSDSQSEHGCIKSKGSYNHDEEDDTDNQKKDENENAKKNENGKRNENGNENDKNQTKKQIVQNEEAQQEKGSTWKYSLTPGMALRDYQLIEQNES